jgi:hypothetical protein
MNLLDLSVPFDRSVFIATEVEVWLQVHRDIAGNTCNLVDVCVFEADLTHLSWIQLYNMRFSFLIFTL